MLGHLRLIIACVSVLFVGVFADVEVSIKLQHNLGEGFVDAAVITGTVEEQVHAWSSYLRLCFCLPGTKFVAHVNLAFGGLYGTVYVDSAKV